MRFERGLIELERSPLEEAAGQASRDEQLVNGRACLLGRSEILRSRSNELEVERRRLSDEGDSLLDVGNARKLDDEAMIVGTDDTSLLHLNDRLRDAEEVDASFDDIGKGQHCAVNVRRVELGDVSPEDEM